MGENYNPTIGQVPTFIEGADDLPSATLTNTQRRAFAGETEPTHKRKFKERLRDRIQAGVIDGMFLDQIPADQRREIFNPVHKPNPNASVESVRWDEVARARCVQNGAGGWLSFLYRSITEVEPLIQPLDDLRVHDEGHPEIHFDFETLLREAVETVVESRGRRLTDFQFSIETEPIQTRDIEELRKKFDQREGLSYDEIQELHARTDLTGSDVEEYYAERFND